MDDLISRADALEAIKWMPVEDTDAKTVQRCIEAVSNLPSAQPEPEEFEWCTGCKEHDQEKHCCHRWTKVIRKTVAELKQSQWIPCSIKIPKKTDLYYVTIRDEDGTEYTSCMCYYINLARWEVDVNVIAWMPSPDPYEGAKDETD